MAFASPKGSGMYGDSRSSARSPRQFAAEGNPSNRPHLWPSETDPNRAHWLKNEVVAFERVLVTLREERDASVAILKMEEDALADQLQTKQGFEADLDKRTQRLGELEIQNNEMKERILQLQDHLSKAEEAQAILQESTDSLSADLSMLEKEHRQKKEQVGVQQTVQLRLQRKCVDNQAQLEKLRNNPAVPKEYADFVAKAEAVNQQRIAVLQEELERLMPQEDALVGGNEAANAELVECKMQLAAAQKAITTAEQKMAKTEEKKAAMLGELDELQQLYYNLPPKVEEETVIKEVTKVVEKRIVF